MPKLAERFSAVEMSEMKAAAVAWVAAAMPPMTRVRTSSQIEWASPMTT